MQKDYRFLELKLTRGRTMLEMLGTLAIIGVLSLGGLFGYKMAINQHRANETIHDVMLRASNVPMTWTKYQEFAPEHEFNYPELGVEEGKISTMGYRLNTLKTEEYGYTYKVEAPSVPVEVCRRILRLEPTDIDELRVGRGKNVYSRGSWDLCNQTESDTVEMNFYFEKACVTDENCSGCQSCEKGFCKANYNLPNCGKGPNTSSSEQCECPEYTKPCSDAKEIDYTYFCAKGGSKSCKKWDKSNCGDCYCPMISKPCADAPSYLYLYTCSSGETVGCEGWLGCSECECPPKIDKDCDGVKEMGNVPFALMMVIVWTKRVCKIHQAVVMEVQYKLVVH